MAFLNGIADLPTSPLFRFHNQEEARECTRGNALYDLADYIRSATLSDVAHDAADTAWGILAPVWLQRQQRIRLVEKMMKEVSDPDLAS